MFQLSFSVLLQTGDSALGGGGVSNCETDRGAASFLYSKKQQKAEVYFEK